jgi:hypothetical protein
LSSTPHLAQRVGRALAQQHARLGQVRREHRRERQDRLDEHRGRVLRQQAVAALGDHHRVDDDVRGRAGRDRLREPLGDRARDRRRAEHADLRGVDAHVGTPWMPVTACVFCAVSAATTPQP